MTLFATATRKTVQLSGVMRFKGEQTYQVITIDGDKLHFEARSLTHQLMDGFTLVKRPGAGLSLVEEGPALSTHR